MEKEEDIIIKNINYYEMNAERYECSDEYKNAIKFYEKAINELELLFKKYPSNSFLSDFGKKLDFYSYKIKKLETEQDEGDLFSEIFYDKYGKEIEEINKIEDNNELK